MVLEGPQLDFLPWLLARGGLWLIVMLALTLLVCLGTWVLLSIAYGPVEGLRRQSRAIGGALGDWRQTSWRRIMALAMLALKESIRRRVVVVVVLFVIMLLFAGWFLSTSGRDPAGLYLEFVLTATTYLMLALAVMLSAFSLPDDFKHRTIFTVLSKPVRRHELVLGRIIGFSLTGTVLLLAMGLMSYGFVMVGLDHTHRIEPEDVQPVAVIDPNDPMPVVARGETKIEHGHKHEIEVRRMPDGTLSARLGDEPNHWHEVFVSEIDGRTVYEVSPPRDMLRARVPVYGSLMYLNREGQVTVDDRTGRSKGINVGKEWTYRQCIEGATEGAGIWSFRGINRDRFSEGLPLEMTLGVFRTYKGDIERGIMGQIVLRNPHTQVESSPRFFVAREYYIHKLRLGQPQRDANGEIVYDTAGRPVIVVPGPDGPLNLFNDLVYDDPDLGGRLQIIIRCQERSQYFCMAGPDLYLRADDAPFWMNFIKGYFSIWLQMTVVMAAGVFWSTFLRGPVALFATGVTVIFGFFTEFMMQVATGTRADGSELEGGGPAESALRIFMQKNLMEPLEPGLVSETVKAMDAILNPLMAGQALLVPNFLVFNDSAFVAQGFNIPVVQMTQHVLMALAFIVPLVIGAHLALRTREVDE